MKSVEPPRNARRLREPKTPRERHCRESETGAATEGRPYRAFHCSRVVPVPS